MSISITSQISSISQRLRAAEKILQDVAFDANIESSALEKVDDLELDAFKVLRLIRFLKNRFTPINRIPPEVLTLIPDFWSMGHRDEDLITVTHVCRTWRETFISRSSLWTNFDCKNAEKTRVYLERSKSSPINLCLDRDSGLSPCDPFLQIVPHSVDRLKFLSVKGTPESLQDITSYLSFRAPLLEWLDVGCGSRYGPQRNPVLTTALLNGDLSSLHGLRLRSVSTELPWRNMTNLTSFILCYIAPGDLTIRQLLDFFENAPRLRSIKLNSATPASGGQNGRLVSLACLKKMDILWGEPASLLLDHLLIPVGAKLTKWVTGSFDRVVADLPKSLDNLRNISDFTKIHIQTGKHYTCMQLRGPNGQLCIASHIDIPYSGLESLAPFDTSSTVWLEVVSTDHPFKGPPHRTLHPLSNLRTLTLTRCKNPCNLMVALHPNFGWSAVVACPKLGELVFVLRTDREEFDIRSVVEMAAVRASRGAKLRTIKIVGRQDKLNLGDLFELRKHVSHVEFDPEVDVASDSDDSDEAEY